MVTTVQKCNGETFDLTVWNGAVKIRPLDGGFVQTKIAPSWYGTGVVVTLHRAVRMVMTRLRYGVKRKRYQTVHNENASTLPGTPSFTI